MAKKSHLERIKQGVSAWNELRKQWDEEHFFGFRIQPKIVPNLSGANLAGEFLCNANFSNTNLAQANLAGANLTGADLKKAILTKANLSRTNLSGANLEGANLCGANLERAQLVGTNLSEAVIADCFVFGIAAWDIKLVGTAQQNLRITPHDEPYSIMVDNLEVAQFIYLLLNNEKIRDIIDTIAKKVVLILGRFTSERKIVLDEIRDELRKKGYTPVLFDFNKPGSRDLTETIVTLAHMSRFVIADITDAKSIPQELQAIVPHLPSVPIQPLICAPQESYALFEHFKRYPWVLREHIYQNSKDLMLSFDEKVILPAEKKRTFG